MTAMILLGTLNTMAQDDKSLTADEIIKRYAKGNHFFGGCARGR